uniref:DNA-directed DNA polymerase n=1 Tax=viral metagenome TaxID=1070528 RepID=A0A6C0LDP7_9ZZZZ
MNINLNRKCPEGKVVNPLTGRCIKKEALEKKMKKIEKDKAKEKDTDNDTENNTDSNNDIIINVQPSNNKKIVDSLKILADYERINKEPFKVKAYEKVIDSIELFDKNIETPEDIKLLKGVGKKIEDKIIEFLDTGNIAEVNSVLSDPQYILGNKLKSIYGVGPAKITELMTKIKDFDELKEHPELLNDKQKIGLKYYDDMNIRIPIAEGKQHFKIVHKILNNLYQGIEFEFVGSFRRKNKDLGDIDILIKNRSGLVLKDVIKQLEDKSYVIEKLAQGNNKFMGICKLSPELPARRIDILIAEPSYYYFALLYFTGSYNFNIYMRKIALKKGLSLSEYGFKAANAANAGVGVGVANNKNIIDTTDSIHSEEDIFKYLDMAFVEPYKR